MIQVGATPKMASIKPLEPPAKKVKLAEGHVPEVLQTLVPHPERLAEALALSSSFHVLDIGMVDAWLGYGLVMAWTGHAEYRRKQ